MKIGVFGLGYVGCVSIACLSKNGYQVTGVDIDKNKVDLINTGKSTIIEKNTDELISEGVVSKTIFATLDAIGTIENTDVSFICVGTPNLSSGKLDMSGIHKVAELIGLGLKNITSYHTIVIRSTVMPGTYNIVAKLISDFSGKEIDKDFGLVLNPEFLREGSAIEDFYNPPFTVLSTTSEYSMNIMKDIFSFVDAPIHRVDVGVAELIKFLNNSYHALKVSFANEIGRICKSMKVDSRALMDLFVKDTILNISPKYFKPGFSFGGSCLPKDLLALKSLANYNNIESPIINSIEVSNNFHDDYVYEKIVSYNKKNIGVLGLSFKKGTDDLRFSPSLKLCERLYDHDYEVKIFDKDVSLSSLMGKNKDYLLNNIPHIEKMLFNEINTFLDKINILVVVHYYDEIGEVLKNINGDIIILDIADSDVLDNGEAYNGLLW